MVLLLQAIFRMSMLLKYCVCSFQLICTVTPSTNNSEETHNTLKFAHRAKHIEIQAAQNKVYYYAIKILSMSMLTYLKKISYLNLQIIDEKSLIKKYQHEIRTLKEELEQMQRGVAAIPQLKHSEGDDLVTLKQEVPQKPAL